MRCPSCGEENPPAALICGLCRTLFAPAGGARTGQSPPPVVIGPVSAERAAAGRGSGKALTAITATVGLVVAAIAIGGAAYRFVRKRPSASERPSATVPAPPSDVGTRPASRPIRPGPPAPGMPDRPASQPAHAALPASPILEVAPPEPPRRRSVSARWFEQHGGHREALEEQQRTNAPMLVYFRVDWCPYCQRMDSAVVTQPDVKRSLDEIVKARINPETSPADRALADRYGVKSYPSVFVIPAPGASPQKIASFTRTGKEDIDVSAARFLAAIAEVGIDQAGALIAQGDAKRRRGDLAGAAGDLDRAIQLDPTSGAAHYWRGKLAAQAGELGAAAGYFKRAASLDPKDTFSRAELAGLYGRNGQWDEAIGALDGLIAADPGWQGGAAYAMRATAHERKGQTDRAGTDNAEACRRGYSRACGRAAPPP